MDAPSELEGQVGVESLTLGDNHISDCTKYDLYSVIHHVGVMVSALSYRISYFYVRQTYYNYQLCVCTRAAAIM